MAEKTFRVCISIKIKTALREGGLFGLTQVCVSTRRFIRHPIKKLPTFSGKWVADDVYGAV